MATSNSQVLLQGSLDFLNVAIHSPNGSRSSNELPLSWKNSKTLSASWKGLLRTSNSQNQHKWSHLSQKKEGLHPQLCLELSSSCCPSSTRSWHHPRGTYDVEQGCRERAMPYGLADESSQLVMVAGYAPLNGWSVGRMPRRRRHQRKIYTQVREFGIDCAITESTGSEGQLNVPVITLEGTFRRRKYSGLISVPVAVKFTKDDLPNGSLRDVCCCCSSNEHGEAKSADAVSEVTTTKDESVDNAGVQMALALLRFYKREISPYIPASCRYVPTCSEYAQQAYKRYGFVKGSILTAWRLARCNPLGSSGYDPPRWFGEERPPQE
ncbi:hypothetical protein R1flu_021853 [Riccia fluitans]|uniref:Membrane protein insertion efficiency factor n=1 Tax=Riccia fluitans TaxID=41844 RepID=A0ABD1ZQW9_9MARC